MSETNNAREIFQSAYESRYTWDENFPGYTANLEIKQGDETYQGKVKVNPDLSVEISGIEDEKVRESVYNQMRDIITHRKRSTFAAAHGKNQFKLGEKDSTGAVEILVSGDAMGSNYKVRGQEITQVSRVMGPMAFTINTKESLDTGNGYVSTAYNAVFRDAKTNELKGKRDFEETYDKVGEYYLPSRQIIHAISKDGQTTTTEFNFSNLQLLEPAPVA
ncbi:DUF3386 domain-containing protein [Oscillatoria salina]|uniref:DUF3386 domain-containing protein n=1 Tax=Oscillatoria salina TaxID=331517 RepID=UPI0013BA9B1C|nr:DUF3386 domain-containing protein [Oscillatoria salina]MBZ8179044.1 DUF3386 domain-containing protein [Oscillatoria salina IIICB1]NET88497.1 DUF3386 domain-containing protein [Kamptonema sp. SIO1D9]